MSEQSLQIRSGIQDLESYVRQMPNVLIGDNDMCPLKHSFAEGLYVREIFIPKGMFIIGKIHKYSHPNFLLKGDVSVLTEDGPRRIKSPCSMISPAGTKRVVFAHEDCIWITVHVTKETDLDKIEEEVIAKDYSELSIEENRFIEEITE